MRNIVIVDALSTGYNYVEDIVKRGYKPVVLNTKKNEDTVVAEAEKAVVYHHDPVVIDEKDSYDETLQMVRKLDPVLVLPGSEPGVILATKLADDLNLPGNPTKNLDVMTLKGAMHEALKKAGLRYILGETVTSPEAAVAFCEKNHLDHVVVKPVHSAGSMGVTLCNGVRQVRDAVERLLKDVDFYGYPIREVLVQERIFGTEYIVNTVSKNGQHRFNTILRYIKEVTSEGGYIYDYAEFLPKLEEGHRELIRYALQVADAIQYQNGTIHGEYMIDSKGPVLIEVNCRPMGAGMPAEYLDLITGQHETDTVLDTLLDPDKFDLDLAKPYDLMHSGCVKLIMVPEDMEAEDYPIWEIAKRLRSTYQISVEKEAVRNFVKTVNMDTNGGVLYLENDDENALRSDLNIIRDIEKKQFKLILNDGMSRKWFVEADETVTDFRKVIKDCDCHGATLVACDDQMELENVQCITPDSLQDAVRGFDNVIIGYKRSLPQMKESECLRLIFDTMDMVRPGGRVIIPRSTCNYISYGEKGAEVLMLVKGLTLKNPVTSDDMYVIGMSE